MRALAEAVGARAPTLYDYFASKEDVLNAIFKQGVELLAAQFAALTEHTEPGLDRMMRLGIEYRRWGLANPDMYQLIFGRIDQSYVPGIEQQTAAAALFQTLTNHVADSMNLGELAPQDPAMTAMTIWSMTHGFVSLELFGMAEKCGTAPPDDQFAFVLSTLLYGLINRDASGAPAAQPPSLAQVLSHTNAKDGMIVTTDARNV
jgi:AcrR family transcriptional regulator